MKDRKMKDRVVQTSYLDGVRTLVICRPEQRNAMNMEVRAALLDELHSAEADPDCIAVIIHGEGGQAFSAGADILELAERTPVKELERGAELRRELPRVIETLQKPTVAAIDGWCLGAGLEVAVACTFRIATSDARLGLPEINLGVIPGSGGTQRLGRLVGLGRALEMTILGEHVDGEAAALMGLVNRVVPRERLLDEAAIIARAAGAKPRLAFINARDAVLKSFDVDIATGIEFERKAFAICAGSDDKREGVRAFLEKRQPVFIGS